MQQQKPHARVVRDLRQWWRDRRRPREKVLAERAVLRALRRQKRWGDGYIAMPVTTLASVTGLPKVRVTAALDVLRGRGKVRGFTYEGRVVYLPSGRVPSGVVTRGGSVRRG